MGTTLTGTTPQDTYDSLIKVTDNGPLSATAKYLSDGLGNDSALALSTTAVGIGTSSLFAELQVNKASDVTLALSNSTAVTSGNRGSLSFYNSAVSTVALIKATAVTDNVGTQLEFYTRPAAGSLAQTMTIASTGNVGIGTSAPTAGYKLDVAGRTKAYNAGYIADFVSTASNASSIQLYADDTNVSIVQGGTAAVPLTFFVGGTEKMRIQSGGGISFNGDTAAANALDDYEEGTFTATLKGGTTDPTTPVTTTGTYTKIGRQVSITLSFINVNTTGASGDVTVSGIPFNAAGNNVGSLMIYNFNMNTATAQNAYVSGGAIEFLGQINNAAWASLLHNAGASRYLITSVTYFV